MGASVPYYVRVQVLREEWREVSAVTGTEAEEEVYEQGGIVNVLYSQQDEPEDY